MSGFPKLRVSVPPTMPVTLHLLVVNALMLLATAVFGLRGVDLNDWLGLHYYDAPNHHAWQYVTYMFMHGGFMHLFFNMWSLYMFAPRLERDWGARRFLVYYFATGIGAAVAQQIAWRYGIVASILGQAQAADPTFTYAELTEAYGTLLDRFVTVGASGAVFGILLAYGMMYPNDVVMLLFPPLPLKVKWLVMGYGLVELYAGVSSNGDGVAHFAHLGGMVFGLLLILWWRRPRRPRMKVERGGWHYSTVEQQKDMDYNAELRARRDEIDRILDKISQRGYDGLTEEEKRKLFEASKKK